MIGPGRYDPQCTRVRQETGAEGVVLIVMGRAQGHGMSVQGTLEMHAMLPGLLRTLADQIEKETRRVAS